MPLSSECRETRLESLAVYASCQTNVSCSHLMRVRARAASASKIDHNFSE